MAVFGVPDADCESYIDRDDATAVRGEVDEPDCILLLMASVTKLFSPGLRIPDPYALVSAESAAPRDDPPTVGAEVQAKDPGAMPAEDQGLAADQVPGLDHPVQPSGDEAAAIGVERQGHHEFAVT